MRLELERDLELFFSKSLKQSFTHLWCSLASEHGRPGQVCGMLPVPEDNLSSMIYLSSNELSGPKWMLNCKQIWKNYL